MTDSDDEPIVERVSPFERAQGEPQSPGRSGTRKDWALYKLQKKHHKRTVACVRCGHSMNRRGNRPLFDDAGVAWYECPQGCEPPEDADWPATAVGTSDIGRSAFTPDLLGPEDHLGPDEADEPDAPGEAPADDEPEGDDPPNEQRRLHPIEAQLLRRGKLREDLQRRGRRR